MFQGIIADEQKYYFYAKYHLLDRLRMLIFAIMTNPKRKRDTNQLAKQIVELSTDGPAEPEIINTKNQAAVELGRLGGLKGGKARALSEHERSEIAKKAAKARWKKP